MTRAALIGAGYIAREHLRSLRQIPGVEVTALCDRSPTLAAAMADEFGVPRWYADAEKLLVEERPDVVHVTTPPQSHVALASLALKAGCHVFVEKPLALSLAESEALLDLAAACDRWLIEDHNYLFNPAVQSMLDWKRGGELGEVVHLDVLFAADALGGRSRHADAAAPESLVALPGSALIDFATHLAYLACAFIGAARSVSTTWRAARASGSRWDEFRALVEGEHATASLGWSANAQPDSFSLRVHGTKLRATASLFEPLLAVERLHAGPRPLVPLRNGLSVGASYASSALLGLWRKLQGRPVTYAGLSELLRLTYAALASGAPPPISALEIRAANRLVWRMLEQEPRP